MYTTYKPQKAATCNLPGASSLTELLLNKEKNGLYIIIRICRIGKKENWKEKKSNETF